MTLRLHRILRCVSLITVLAFAGAATIARGDGDPASDVLLEQRVFYPYAAATSAVLERRLDGATAAAARVGVPVKVALIGSAVDLGAITQLWRRPQPYADYLGSEISFTQAQRLLVVMPDGYGTYGLAARQVAAVEALARPAGSGSDALAQAAIVAVRRIAAAAGHPIATDATAAGGGSDVTAILVAALGVAALGIVGAIARVTLRRAQTAAAGTRRRRR